MFFYKKINQFVSKNIKNFIQIKKNKVTESILLKHQKSGKLLIPKVLSNQIVFCKKNVIQKIQKC